MAMNTALMQSNMDVIYFFYGLAFVVMGIAILAQPKKESGFRLAGSLWLLAWFGIIHGANEFLDMWEFIKKTHDQVPEPVGWACLLVSYFFLFEAGRKFLAAARPEGPGWRGRLLAFPARRLYPAATVAILLLCSLSSDFWHTGRILARYFLGLPGGLFAGLGLLAYYRHEERVLAPLRVRKFFLLAGLGLAAYGLLSGLVVPPGGFFPASRLNTDSFLGTVGLPVQMFRALCAVGISWGVLGMLTIFAWELKEKLQCSLMESSPDCILHVSLEGRLIDMNRLGCSFYGTGSPLELLGKYATLGVVENRDGMADAIKRAARGETVGVDCASSGRKGRRMMWSAIASPVKGLDGSVKSVLLAARDITGRRETEAALRESQERFRLFVEIAPEAIFVQIEGRFAYLNPAALALFGVSEPAAVLGRPILERIHPDYHAAVRGRIRLINQERAATPALEEKFLRLDGTVVEVEVTAVPTEFLGKSGALVFARDISERSKAAAALREKDMHLQTILQTIPNPVFVKDTAGVYRECNEAFLEFFGRGREEVIGRTVFDIVPREAAAVFQAKDRELFEQRSLLVYEAQAQNAQAELRDFIFYKAPYYDAAGALAGLVGVMLDITERRKSETALQNSHGAQLALNEMLQASLSPLPLPQKLDKVLNLLLAIPWFNVERKGCIFINEGSTLRMTAQSGLSEPVLKACGRLPLGRCLCGRVAQTGQEIMTADLDERHEVSYEGMHRHGHICLPIRGDGRVMGVLSLYLAAGAAPDLRAQGLARAAADIIAGVILLSRSEELLMQGQKMEAVGRLAGGVAHDFNNILTAIKGYSEFLISAFTADDPRRDDAQEILKAADRAAALTRQLLAFSRRQVLSPCVLDLNETVSGMVKMLRRLLGEDVRIEVRLAQGPVRAFVDPGQMEQVVMNLAVNARDAMPEGGALTIATANVCRTPGADEVPAGLAGQDCVMLAVADTGKGMSPELLGHIFEPFFTTKPKGKGTGLGLATVYGIVKQSGGDIEVSSEPGQGSVFRVFLPASRRPAEAAEPSAGKGEPPPTGTETVLLVEDEDTVRSLAERTLSRAGYRVLAAANAQEALGVLQRHGERVHLLLSDVVMPGLSGPALAAKVLESRPGTKVLYMSGNEDGILAKHGVLDSAVTLLQKPFSTETLARKVREVLDAPNAP